MSSLIQDSPHVRYTKIIDYSKNKAEVPTYCDSINDTISINGWAIYREIDSEGRIKLTAHKGLIEFSIKTKEKSVLPIKKVKDKLQSPWEQPKYIEVPDGRNKVSDSLEKDRFIEKHYRDSSILSPTEYMDSLIPEFYEIAKIPELSKIVAKIQAVK